MKLHLITFVFAAFILNSCGPTKSTDSIEDTNSIDSMEGTNSVFTKIPTETFWKLETLEGKDFSDFKKQFL